MSGGLGKNWRIPGLGEFPAAGLMHLLVVYIVWGSTYLAIRIAVNNLGALINHVEAQQGKKIDGEIADEIIDRALTVIGSLGS